MSKKNLKKFAAVTLATSMAFGSTMMVFAEGEGDTTTSSAGVAEGTGSYEGGEMKYPTLQVTLPTIPAGTYDYIADPNGLIKATNNEKYTSATFSGDTGIFFETSEKTYSEKSAAQTVTNENAQDIDVTVKLEQKTAGDAIVKYAESAEFESDDTENKLYLAITDDATTNAKAAALTSTGAATITTTVAGVPDNYEPGYNSTDDKYEYVKKGDADLSDWNDCSFILTGAVNTKATWGDDVKFPEIKVTWSYKEHKDSVFSASSVSATANTLTVTDAAVTIKKVTVVRTDGTQVVWTAGNQFTFANGKLTFKTGALGANAGNSLNIELSTGVTETIAIQ